jgi:outer membrane receptor protein involved in Fe transport
MNLRKTLWGSRHEYKATFQFQMNDQINANFSLLRYSGKGILSLTLLDCSINWVLNTKYRFYLQGFNLLNKKWFVEQFIQTNSISINKQQLIGRRVSLGFDLPL